MEAGMPSGFDARACLKRGRELLVEGRFSEAVALYATLIERLGVRLSEPVRERVLTVVGELPRGDLSSGREAEAEAVLAEALVRLGIALARCTAPDALLAVYDEVEERLGGSSRPETRVMVAHCLYARALGLERLRPTNTDAALVAFEKAFAYGAIPNPKVGGRVASAMSRLAGELHSVGRSDDALRVYDAIVAHLRAIDEPTVREEVASAFMMKGYTLGQIGRIDQADEVYAELFTHFGDRKEISLKGEREAVRDLFAADMQRDGERLAQDGRPDDAIAHFDAALRLLSDAREPVLLRRRLACLTAKGRLLQHMGHDQEAIVVLDSALAAYAEQPAPERDPESIARAVLGLLLQAAAAGTYDPVRSAALIDDLGRVIDDVTAPIEQPLLPAAEPATDEAIAGQLTELIDREFWVQIAMSDNDPASTSAMRAAALALYRLTGTRLADIADGPSGAAVLLIRVIADAHAMVSRPWSSRERAELPTVSSLLVQRAIEQAGLAEWAAENRHPLSISAGVDSLDEKLAHDLLAT